MRIVPSTGFITAAYAPLVAAVNAAATVAASAASTRENSSLMPRRICDRITPELPRAPISEPWLTALQVGAIAGSASSSSVITDSSVRAMLVPVSPSGTG